MFLEHVPRRKTGFTLIELLIGISIFSVIVIIVSSLFITSFRLNQEAAIREQLYSDARFTLERLATAIRSGTIDYEEYFNRTVRGGDYGKNYGWYKRQFYSPGDDTAYGNLCNNGEVWTPGVSCVIQKESRDTNSGQNPYRGNSYLSLGDVAASLGDVAAKIKAVNALCGLQEFNDLTVMPDACDDPDDSDAPSFAQNELYIISADGKEKTMFIREQISWPDAAPVHALSILKMIGSDTNGDVFPDTFDCSENFNCGSGLVDSNVDTDAAGVLENFVPITPNRLNVRNITFYIAPLENPFYAFLETDREIQHLPFVTILLTVEPSPQIGINVQQFRMTLQETVSTGLLRSAPAPIPGQFDARPTPPSSP